MTALIAPAKTNLDQAVTDGKITSAQETTILTNLTTRLTNLVNGTKPSTRADEHAAPTSIVTFATLKAFAQRHR